MAAATTQVLANREACSRTSEKVESGKAAETQREAPVKARPEVKRGRRRMKEDIGRGCKRD